jgi:hypothetical protein
MSQPGIKPSASTVGGGKHPRKEPSEQLVNSHLVGTSSVHMSTQPRRMLATWLHLLHVLHEHT